MTGMPTRVGTPIGIGGLVDVVNNLFTQQELGLYCMVLKTEQVVRFKIYRWYSLSKEYWEG